MKSCRCRKPDKIPDHGYPVFGGLDVGKAVHHACALDPAGRRLHDKALPNDEVAVRSEFTDLAAHGRVLVIVDQPASIGALPIAVTRSLGIDVAYLPGLAMRRIADLYPGQGKTDARDAFIIADAARTMAHTLRRVGTDDETLAELCVLADYDDDLAAQATRLILSGYREHCPNLARIDLIDTVRLARNLHPDLPKHGLNNLLHHLRIPTPPNRHRAMADVRLTTELFIRMTTASDWADLRQLRGLAGCAAEAAQPEQVSLFG